MTPFLFEILFTDGRAERVVVYASSRREADRIAARWAERHGVDAVVPVYDEDAA